LVTRSCLDATLLGYAAEVIVAYLLLATPVVAAFFFWGAWGWVAAAAAVAAVEYATLQRSQQFSARVWRSVAMTKLSKRERGIETIYVISAVVGVAF
jgi:high-affinity Fe2+/Pb2+ permease